MLKLESPGAQVQAITFSRRETDIFDVCTAVVIVKGFPSKAIDLARQVLSASFGEAWKFTKISCLPPSERQSERDWLVTMEATNE